MRNFADTPWVWLLGYVLYTDVTFAAFPPRTSQIEKTGDFSSLNKILSVGGYECPPHSQPWQAALFLGDEINCAGVLVHPQWVLSAAHCYKGFDSIGLGLHSLDPKEETGSQMIKPNISVPHPYYRFSTEHVNDIMLIKLSEPAVISDTVKPIRMAFRCPKPGNTCRVSGWGGSSQDTPFKFLQCLDTTVLSTEICREIHPTTSFHKMFCTYSETYKGSAYGDSGGPVVCNGKLLGTISGGSLSSDDNADIHICTFRYKHWIQRILETY